MDSDPNDPFGDGRDPRGRFVKGNAGGPGNPHAARVSKLRTALLEAVSVEDIQAVVAALVRQARQGDVQAARELLTRALGRPLEPDLLDRLEVLEAQQEASKAGQR